MKHFSALCQALSSQETVKLALSSIESPELVKAKEAYAEAWERVQKSFEDLDLDEPTKKSINILLGRQEAERGRTADDIEEYKTQRTQEGKILTNHVLTASEGEDGAGYDSNRGRAKGSIGLWGSVLYLGSTGSFESFWNKTFGRWESTPEGQELMDQIGINSSMRQGEKVQLVAQHWYEKGGLKEHLDALGTLSKTQLKLQEEILRATESSTVWDTLVEEGSHSIVSTVEERTEGAKIKGVHLMYPSGSNASIVVAQSRQPMFGRNLSQGVYTAGIKSQTGSLEELKELIGNLMGSRYTVRKSASYPYASIDQRELGRISTSWTQSKGSVPGATEEDVKEPIGAELAQNLSTIRATGGEGVGRSSVAQSLQELLSDSIKSDMSGPEKIASQKTIDLVMALYKPKNNLFWMEGNSAQKVKKFKSLSLASSGSVASLIGLGGFGALGVSVLEGANAERSRVLEELAKKSIHALELSNSNATGEEKRLLEEVERELKYGKSEKLVKVLDSLKTEEERVLLLDKLRRMFSPKTAGLLSLKAATSMIDSVWEQQTVALGKSHSQVVEVSLQELIKEARQLGAHEVEPLKNWINSLDKSKEPEVSSINKLEGYDEKAFKDQTLFRIEDLPKELYELKLPEDMAQYLRGAAFDQKHAQLMEQVDGSQGWKSSEKGTKDPGLRGLFGLKSKPGGVMDRGWPADRYGNMKSNMVFASKFDMSPQGWGPQEFAGRLLDELMDLDVFKTFGSSGDRQRWIMERIYRQVVRGIRESEEDFGGSRVDKKSNELNEWATDGYKTQEARVVKKAMDCALRLAQEASSLGVLRERAWGQDILGLPEFKNTTSMEGLSQHLEYDFESQLGLEKLFAARRPAIDIQTLRSQGLVSNWTDVRRAVATSQHHLQTIPTPTEDSPEGLKRLDLSWGSVKAFETTQLGKKINEIWLEASLLLRGRNANSGKIDSSYAKSNSSSDSWLGLWALEVWMHTVIRHPDTPLAKWIAEVDQKRLVEAVFAQPQTWVLNEALGLSPTNIYNVLNGEQTGLYTGGAVRGVFVAIAQSHLDEEKKVALVSQVADAIEGERIDYAHVLATGVVMAVHATPTKEGASPKLSVVEQDVVNLGQSMRGKKDADLSLRGGTTLIQLANGRRVKELVAGVLPLDKKEVYEHGLDPCFVHQEATSNPFVVSLAQVVARTVRLDARIEEGSMGAFNALMGYAKTYAKESLGLSGAAINALGQMPAVFWNHLIDKAKTNVMNQVIAEQKIPKSAVEKKSQELTRLMNLSVSQGINPHAVWVVSELQWEKGAFPLSFSVEAFLQKSQEQSGESRELVRGLKKELQAWQQKSQSVEVLVLKQATKELEEAQKVPLKKLTGAAGKSTKADEERHVKKAANVLRERMALLGDWARGEAHVFWENLPVRDIGWGSLMRGQERWHEEVQFRRSGSFISWEPSMNPLKGTGDTAGWRAEELTNSDQLAREGKAMKHCVGSYAPRCLSEGIRIVSITHEGVRKATVELRQKESASGSGRKGAWHITQNKASCNQEPTKPAKDFSSVVVEHYNTSWEKKLAMQKATKPKAHEGLVRVELPSVLEKINQRRGERSSEEARSGAQESGGLRGKKKRVIKAHGEH